MNPWRDYLPPLLLAFAGLFLLGLGIAFGADVKMLQKQMLAPVAQLNRDCSATFIHSERDEISGEVRTLLLTAAHCVEGKEGIEHTIYSPTYKSGRIISEGAYKARVKGKYHRHDIALLELLDKETLFQNLARIAPRDVELFEGEPAWVVGYPLGKSRTMTIGILGPLETLGFPSPKSDMEYQRSTAQIAGGNSGGALFHETEGGFEMVGVISAFAPSSSFVTLSVPIEAIRDYLKVALSGSFGGV